MQMNPYSMGPFRGGFYGRFPMRGMMRRPWRHFPPGTEFYHPSFDFGHFPCRGGHGRGRRNKSQRRRKNEETKKKLDGKDEDDIVIDDSDESPDAEFENLESDSFEVNVNVRGCDPNNIKVAVKDGLLKIEGRTKTTDPNFISVSHEQTIPEKVKTDNLKAFLHPEGILTISEVEEGIVPIQLNVEK